MRGEKNWNLADEVGEMVLLGITAVEEYGQGGRFRRAGAATWDR
jgi:hypothetical protein